MDNNPLKQYFRRPAVYLKLPSGGNGYNSDVINMSETGELPVYPMTAIDDITARTPDALFNGTAVVDIIKSCIPDIKDPWSIKSNDMDAILISIKTASGNGEMDIESVCPKCEEMNSYSVNLGAILSTLKSGNYDKLIDLGDLKIKFKPLEFREMNQAAIDQFEIQRVFASLDSIESEEDKALAAKNAFENITLLTMNLLSKTIEYIQTPDTRVEETSFILDYIKNCDRNIYKKIRDYQTNLRTGTEVKPLDVTCPSCDNKYQQQFSINPTDFFD